MARGLADQLLVSGLSPQEIIAALTGAAEKVMPLAAADSHWSS